VFFGVGQAEILEHVAASDFVSVLHGVIVLCQRRSRSQGIGIRVSHPCAKSAQGWGTQLLFFIGIYGTTEVVPFPILLLAGAEERVDSLELYAALKRRSSTALHAKNQPLAKPR
jgi:hypothetical protein